MKLVFTKYLKFFFCSKKLEKLQKLGEPQDFHGTTAHEAISSNGDCRLVDAPMYRARRAPRQSGAPFVRTRAMATRPASRTCSRRRFGTREMQNTP